ncbi:hypothetical protein HN51_067691 [Arachis hypogaea]|uniref:Protein kinase domain-containing protein n=2 Tax=Arachis TaxID=3817 RepID=A0A444ZQ17_ARAHY|nr:probably inactive leucine-rich repeat receptor-like protein kinase At5g48380 [Arachis hypogaea]QHO09141.1 putative inactive leucine-rich repeat receptor-like protein kinase [Arachis hypogaea]RYR16299.1 hypothetical protein Ahy_B04g073296 [Arachis hypogaea]
MKQGSMSPKTRMGITITILIFTQILLCIHATETDIFCLKSIKDSLEDPYNFLASWDFNNKTEGVICNFVGVSCWNPNENRVLGIDLSNMRLKGQFPRGLHNCTSLTALDLSSNSLWAPLPSDIHTLLPFAVSIDLSNNNFSGQIPPSLASCTYLNVLKLDGNMLTGGIPGQLAALPRIRTLSFDNNRLSGEVPNLAYGSVSVSYAKNRGLCGGPLEPCSFDGGGGLIIMDQSFKDGLFVGFASSFSFLLACIFFLSNSYWAKLLKWIKHNKGVELVKYVCSIITGRKLGIEADQMPQLQEKGSQKIALLLERLTSTMKFEELNDATDGFSINNAIGFGKMGIMYKGTLANGWHLAIKKLTDSQQFGRQVLIEIRILGKLRHRNIVPLLGFCIENDERILVYPYFSNGRLSKWLHPLETEAMILTWPQRINIALGVARALSWLHHLCNLHVVHLNICSRSILLDKNFEPKLSNFGDAKFLNPNNHESLGMSFYIKDGKKDVYDFGNVIFELVTGKLYEELVESSCNNANLSPNPSSFYSAIDKFIIGEGFESEAFMLIKIACECVQPFPEQRPTMVQVYNKMSSLWEEVHELCGDSNTCTRSESFSATDRDEL